MIFRRIYHPQLAQASYLVGCPASGQALVIDPLRHSEPYLALAQQDGLRIVAVTETHIHADFVSGARELAARSGATLYLSAAGPAAWHYAFAADAQAVLLSGGDTFSVGNLQIDVLHTPGHTPEHLCFLLTDTASNDEPMGVFTGDFVFVGDVGRPDLLESAVGDLGSAQRSAQQLFRSLCRFRALPEYLQLWPGHGAGSACGRALSAVPQSTLGYELRGNWAFQIAEEAPFVQAVLAGQPPVPPYFAAMKRLNKQGPPLCAMLPEPQIYAAEQLAGLLAQGLCVVDTRSAEQYARGHVAGTLNLPFTSSFLSWAGWLLPVDQPLGLIVEDATLAAVREQLLLIGLDGVVGYWTPEALAGQPQTTIQRREPGAVRTAVERGEVLVLDVRDPQEYATGALPGSRNIPLRTLAQQLPTLAHAPAIVVYCQGGTRSAIAASLLSARQPHPVIDLVGGLHAWQAAGFPLEQSESPASGTT